MRINIEFSYRALEKEIDRIKNNLIKKYGPGVSRFWNE